MASRPTTAQRSRRRGARPGTGWTGQTGVRSRYRGNDRLYGGAGNDTLAGGTGNDELHGWAANDVLFGDAGSDALNGGANFDRGYGGAGSDSQVQCERIAQIP